MSNDRANATRIAHSKPAVLKEGEHLDIKAEHYGYLGKIINPSVAEFLANTEALDQIRNCGHLVSLAPRIKEYLMAHIMATLESEGFDDIAAHVNNLHERRGNINFDRYGAVEKHIEAGIGTYIAISKGVYTGMSRAFGSDIASHESNSTILDRIAKLHLQHMGYYTDTYLRPAVLSRSPYNLTSFGTQFEPNSEGGLRYAKGFPQDSLIPTRSISAINPENGRMEAYRFMNGAETKKLKEFPTDGNPTIGCIVTFEPEHVKALWELYATTRRSLELKTGVSVRAINISSSPLDIAGQTEQTAEPSPQFVDQ